MNQIKRILLVGYYGFGNAGDELILRAISLKLKKEIAACELAVLSGNPSRSEFEQGIRALNRWSPAVVLRAIAGCDVLVFGGGGLLQDVTGSVGLWYYLLLLGIGIAFRKKIFVCAVGVGPVRSRFNRILVRVVMNRVSAVTVRDAESRFDLEEMGVKKEIGIAADPVIALPLFSSGERAGSGADHKPAIGIVIRETAGGGALNEALVSLVPELTRKMNAKIFLIPFHPSLDEAAVNALLSKVEGKADLFKWESLDELLDFFSRMDIILSMRLHAAILALLMKKPVVGISVDPKIGNFLKQFSSHSSIRLMRPEECNGDALMGALLQCWENRDEAEARAGERLSGLRERAEQNDLVCFCMNA